MRPRRGLAPAWAGVLVGLLASGSLAACSGAGSGCSGSKASGDGVVTRVPPSCRGEPVRVTGTTLAGQRLDTLTYRGAPLVINVWGSWCGPCRKEAPDLQAASVALAPSGAKVIGIDTREDSPENARAFQRQFKITYPSVVDDGAVLLSLRGAVSPQQTPTTVVLDARGRVAARFTGAVTRTTLLGIVDDVRAGR